MREKRIVSLAESLVISDEANTGRLELGERCRVL